MKKLNSVKAVAGAAMLATLAAPAFGLTTVGSFDCITNNGGCALAESYLSWSFNDATNQFTISNASVVGNLSQISEIYFDVGVGDTVSLTSSTGTVNMIGGSVPNATNPGNLPGGNTITFVADYSWDSGSGNTNGVNAGESVTFTFGGIALGDILGGSVIGGVHLRSIGTGSVSEGLVTVPAIPEPSTYALMFAGLAAVGFMARRRRQA